MASDLPSSLRGLIEQWRAKAFRIGLRGESAWQVSECADDLEALLTTPQGAAEQRMCFSVRVKLLHGVEPNEYTVNRLHAGIHSGINRERLTEGVEIVLVEASTGSETP